MNDIKSGLIDPYNESLGIKVGMNSLQQNVLEKHIKKEDGGS